MADRFKTRPERLAEERERQKAEERKDPPRLDLDYPFRAIPFDPGWFSARPVWALDGEDF